MSMAMKFCDEFALDIALGLDPTRVLEHWGISVAEFEALRKDDDFNRVVAIHAQLLVERGVTTMLRAKAELRNLLPTLLRVANDYEISGTERSKAVEMAMKLAGWIDKEDGKGRSSNGDKSTAAPQQASSMGGKRWGINVVVSSDAPPKSANASRQKRDFNMPIPALMMDDENSGDE